MAGKAKAEGRKSATDPPSKGPGRPRLEINAAQVERLASIFCTNDEIAAVMDCDTRTIERNFAASLKKGRERGRASLRRMQFATARKGSAAMLIFLGKNNLGQSDEPIAVDPNEPKQRGLLVRSSGAGKRSDDESNEEEREELEN